MLWKTPAIGRVPIVSPGRVFWLAGSACMLFLMLNLLLSAVAMPTTVSQPTNASPAKKLALIAGDYQPGLVAVKFKPSPAGTEANPVYDYGQLRPERYLSSEQFREFGMQEYHPDRTLPGLMYYKVSEKADMKALLALLQSDSQVEFAEPNYIRQEKRTVNDTYYKQGRQYGLTKINAEGAWDVTTGTNVIVAIIDSGVRINHQDISQGRILVNQAKTYIRNDVINGEYLLPYASQFLVSTKTLPPLPPPLVDPPSYIINPDAQAPLDYHPPQELELKKFYAAWDTTGHGTAVAGIMAANSNEGFGMAGVNWNALLLPLQVVNEAGQANVVAISSAITYAADTKARIINLSLGAYQRSEVEAAAIRYAQNKGVVVVAAAGNESATASSFPAAYPNVISVGATDANDKPAYFTNSGAPITVTAPGKGIFTTYCAFKDPFEITNNSCIPAKTALFCNGGNLNPDDNDSCISANSFRVYVIFTPPPSPAAGATPGKGTLSYAPRDVYNISYTFLDGTSFAAPYVTGVISLMLSVRPDLGTAAIQSILQQTADRPDGMVASGRDPYYGFGRINAGKAVSAALNDPNIQAKTLLQGTITGANLADVVMGLDQGDRNSTITIPVDPNTGGYRFENLASSVYYLRAILPKQERQLGPVIINSTGQSGQIINVNFDFGTGAIVAGPGAVAPNSGTPNPPVTAPPSPPAPGLPGPFNSPNANYFQPVSPPTTSSADVYYFKEVSHTLRGVFKRYWDTYGGLSIFGFPTSEEFTEQSQTDGKIYLVQYFQRNRFEYHPEYAGTRSEVLLGLLGSELTTGRNFPTATPLSQANGMYFNETKHNLSDRFLKYWKDNGGLAIFGYPISEVMQEGNYQVQYFQRNRFEYHPENAGSQYEVLLGLLGIDLARSKGYLPLIPNATNGQD